MRTVDTNDGSIANLMTPSEAAVLYRVLNAYINGGIVRDSVRDSLPEFLAPLNWLMLHEKLQAIADQPLNDEVDGVDATTVSQEEECVAFSLTVREWGQCLYAMMLYAFGAIISENDLFYVSGCRRHEVCRVLSSLHRVLESDIYALSRSHSRKRPADGQ